MTDRDTASTAQLIEACGYKFESGGYCNTDPSHAVHHGAWRGPEPNHDFVSGGPPKPPPTYEERIRAEARAQSDAAVVALWEAARGTIKACDCGRNPMYSEEQVPHRYECATFKNDRKLVAALDATRVAYDAAKGKPKKPVNGGHKPFGRGDTPNRGGSSEFGR